MALVSKNVGLIMIMAQASDIPLTVAIKRFARINLIGIIISIMNFNHIYAQ